MPFLRGDLMMAARTDTCNQPDMREGTVQAYDVASQPLCIMMTKSQSHVMMYHDDEESVTCHDVP